MSSETGERRDIAWFQKWETGETFCVICVRNWRKMIYTESLETREMGDIPCYQRGETLFCQRAKVTYSLSCLSRTKCCIVEKKRETYCVVRNGRHNALLYKRT